LEHSGSRSSQDKCHWIRGRHTRGTGAANIRQFCGKGHGRDGRIGVLHVKHKVAVIVQINHPLRGRGVISPIETPLSVISGGRHGSSKIQPGRLPILGRSGGFSQGGGSTGVRECAEVRQGMRRGARIIVERTAWRGPRGRGKGLSRCACISSGGGIRGTIGSAGWRASVSLGRRVGSYYRYIASRKLDARAAI